MSSNTKALIHRRLYRALLKAVKPFTPPSPNAAVLSSLLHRSFIPLEVDETLAAQRKRYGRSSNNIRLDPESHSIAEFYSEYDFREGDAAAAGIISDGDEYDEDIQRHHYDEQDEWNSPKRYDDNFLLFRRLLWMIFSDGYSYTRKTSRKIVPCYRFPEHIYRQPNKLRECIRREFRVPDMFQDENANIDDSNNHHHHHHHPDKTRKYCGYLSAAFPIKVRRETAFLSLRKINEKIVWADQMEEKQKKQLQQQLELQKKQLQEKQKQQQKQPPRKIIPSEYAELNNLCKQAAKHVENLPIPTSTKCDFSNFLAPGTYLLAHPHMTGYFRRSVICILKHGNDESATTQNGTINKNNKRDDDNNVSSSGGSSNSSSSCSSSDEKEEKGDGDFGTYGVIVNRVSLADEKNARTVTDVIPFLPKDLVAAFGRLPMKEGGPVHMPSIQMMHSSTSNTSTINTTAIKATNTATNNIATHSSTPSKEIASMSEEQLADDNVISVAQHASILKEIGGTKLPRVHLDHEDEKEVSFRGDIMAAARAVKSGNLDREDFAFFVGASCWYPGQLEKEIKQGFWLLCRGPPEIALTGTCDHDVTEEGEPRPKADLWLSMMTACGDDEAKLAALLDTASEDDEYGAALDEF